MSNEIFSGLKLCIIIGKPNGNSSAIIRNKLKYRNVTFKRTDIQCILTRHSLID